MNNIAQFISVILHPLLMPLIGVFIIFNVGIFEVNIPYEFERYIYLLVTLFSIFIPASIIPLLFYWKRIKSIELNERRERFIPLAFTTATLIILNVLISRNVPIELLNAYSFAIAAAAILVLFGNFMIKISLHLTGLGGITGLITILSVRYETNLFLLLMIVIMLSGIVGTVRLYKEAHNLKEIFLGYALGFISIFGIVYIIVK